MPRAPVLLHKEYVMDEHGFEGLLEQILEEFQFEHPSQVDGGFEENGVLTQNRGLVVHMGDGTEFQLTIVRSR